MKIAVIGLGSIGSRHVDNLLALGHDPVAFDVRPMAEEARVAVLNLESDLADWKPTHAIICTPPATHADWAQRLLKADCHVLIEKPMTQTVVQADYLCLLSEQRSLTLACGYQLRAMASVQQFPRDWKFLHIWDRQNMAAWPANTYDRNWLAEFSHEIDLALYWAGSYHHTVRLDTWPQEQHIVTMNWTDGRQCLIYLSSTYNGYDRRASSDKGNWTFSKRENDLAYKAELQAFLDGKPYCDGKAALDVVRLMEELRG